MGFERVFAGRTNGSPSPRRAWAGSVAAAVGVAIATASGCGGAAPPAQAPVAAKGPPPAAAPAVSAAVPAPHALVLSGRFAHPAASAATLQAWLGLPAPDAPPFTRLLLDDGDVGELVDAERPIDFAVGFSPKSPGLFAAASAVVRDAASARAALAQRYTMTPAEGGVTLLGRSRALSPPRDGAQDDDDEARACELVDAAATEPARLVCGVHADALAQLGPWLARTAWRATYPSDVHVDVRLEPLRPWVASLRRMAVAMVGAQLDGGVGAGMEAVVKATAGDLFDLASDLSIATVDVMLGDGGATLSETLAFSQTTSALARLSTAHPERSAPAPAAFLGLPADAESGLFGRGIDDDLLARARELWLGVAGDWLADTGIPEAARARVAAALGGLVPASPAVYGRGVDGAALDAWLASAGAPEARGGDRPGAARAGVEALLGWRVVEIDEPAERTLAAVKELASSLAQPGVVAALRSRAKNGAPLGLRAVPRVKGSPAADLGEAAAHYVLDWPLCEAAAAAPPAAGPGAPVAKRAAAPPRCAPFAVHGFVVPDGAKTWIGLGGNEALVVSKLAAAKRGSEPATLGTRPDLAPFRSEPIGAGGMFTLRGWVDDLLLDDLLTGHALSPATARLERTARTLGAEPAAVTFSATARAGTPPTVTGTQRIPRALVQRLAPFLASVLR